jgi:tetratricopeptide (TPR) repeat protein
MESIVMAPKRSTLDRGIADLDAGRIADAERYFRMAAQQALTPQVLNNWALCRRPAGDPADALAIRHPLLADPAPAPFSRALASRCCGDLGRRDDARHLLEQAIRDFDSRRPDLAWTEYTADVKQAAADLGDHRLVLELHKRWPGQDLGLGGHLGAVAAFNLGQYEQAIRYWERIADPGWRRPKQGYIIAASLVLDGVAPPFQLEYDPTAGSETPAANPAAFARIVAIGNIKADFLAMLAGPGVADAERYAEMLIEYGGDWGADLGRRLLRAVRVPMPVKMATARALTSRGIFQPGAEIPMVVDGRETRVILRQTEFRPEHDPGLDRLVAEARQLSRAGRRAEAIRILMDLPLERGIAYPPAMLALAEFYEANGRHAIGTHWRGWCSLCIRPSSSTRSPWATSSAAGRRSGRSGRIARSGPIPRGCRSSG